MENRELHNPLKFDSVVHYYVEKSSVREIEVLLLINQIAAFTKIVV